MKGSELRQDLVSGDWILIAPGRAKRPEEFRRKSKPQKKPKSGCPFEDPQKSGNGPVIAVYDKNGHFVDPNSKNWGLQIFPNRYPAVSHSRVEPEVRKKGPYLFMKGVGHHDLLVTRDHNKNFPKLSKLEGYTVLKAFRDRYLSLLEAKDVAYVSMFSNWGEKAGASIYHPHYQLLGVPIIPPVVEHSLKGSEVYFKKNGECVHCTEIAMELHDKKRIVFENACAVAFAPFVSRGEFELRVFPKSHIPFFEETPDSILLCVSEALQKVLRGFETSLNSPDYNFFIHTAPTKNKKSHTHFHWYIEIQPKLNISAGFELSTGIEVNVVPPEDAAKLLRRYV
ncbi:MAG TPA: DUF4921 family protein [Candidatus Paceibacterota bacterium]|nr:DUF4921 family protein [Candidatus Paceibacterota bacterium]